MKIFWKFQIMLLTGNLVYQKALEHFIGLPKNSSTPFKT